MPLTESHIEPSKFGAASVVLRPVRAVRSLGSPILGVVLRAIPLMMWLAIALSAAYFVSILYGVAMGYALPTATIFSAPHASVITRLEASLPRLVLIVCLAGTIAGWLAKAGVIDDGLLWRQENYAVGLLRKWGLLIAGAALVLALTCSAGWDGGANLVANYGSSDSLMGLVPVSDAHGYYVSPVEQVVTGHWSAFASRRPFAAAFRQLLMTAGGFHNLQTLLLQTCLIVAALCLVIRCVILWRGLRSGIAFAALMYVVARPFLPTMLTEPLGLFWALLAVAFTVEALRLNSLPHAWLALTALAFAEAVRMGSMFTIPAFVIWIAIAFGSDFRSRLTLAATGGAVVGLVIFLQSALAAMYGNPEGITGSNFSYTLCGLAAGKDWTACPQLYAKEFNALTTEREQAAFLTAKAFQLMEESPYPMLARMLANVRDVITGIPGFFLYGMDTYHRAAREILFVMALVPGFWLAWRKRTRGEASFWTLLFISVIGSAALIFADDGWRTMHSTWPFVALFLSLGFISPAPLTSEKTAVISGRAGVSLIVVLISLTALVPAAGRAWLGAQFSRVSDAADGQQRQVAILAGSTVTGFLVIPDGASLPTKLPAMHRSDFTRLARDFALERDYGNFMDFGSMQAPYAVIAAARIEARMDSPEYFFIAPAEILTGGSASAWEVEIGRRTQSSQHKDLVLEIKTVQRLEPVRQFPATRIKG